MPENQICREHAHYSSKTQFFIFMQLFLHGQIAEEECRSSRSEIQSRYTIQSLYLRASLFSGVQGSYDMIT